MSTKRGHPPSASSRGRSDQYLGARPYNPSIRVSPQFPPSQPDEVSPSPATQKRADSKRTRVSDPPSASAHEELGTTMENLFISTSPTSYPPPSAGIPAVYKSHYDEDIWLDLPEDVMHRILEMLDTHDMLKISYVCKAWNKVFMNYRALRTHLSFNSWKHLPLLMVHQPVQFGTYWKNVRSLDFSHMYCSQHTIGDHVYLSDHVISWLLSALPHLQHLKIVCCRWVTDNTLAALSRSCPDLRTLSVEGCRKLTPAGIRFLFALKELRVLNLGHIWYRRAEAARHSIRDLNTNLSQLPDHCAKIEHLHVDRLPTVSPGTLVRLCLGYPRLLTLTAWRCKITDAVVDMGISKCPRLRTLHICGSGNVTDAAVLQLAKACPQLRVLDLSYGGEISDVGVRAIAQHLHRLLVLRLNGMERITPASLRILADSTCGPHLRALEVNGCRKICWPVCLLPLIMTWFPRVQPCGFPYPPEVRAAVYSKSLEALASLNQSALLQSKTASARGGPDGAFRRSGVVSAGGSGEDANGEAMHQSQSQGQHRRYDDRMSVDMSVLGEKDAVAAPSASARAAVVMMQADSVSSGHRPPNVIIRK